MLTDEKTMSLLGWLNAPRDPEGQIQRTITRIGVERLFCGIMHDNLCENQNRPNDLFKLSYTTDGEAYLDWILRTEREWQLWVTALSIRGVAKDLLRRLNDE